METTVKQRLTEFLKMAKISKSEFGRIIGVSNAFVTSMRQSISPDKIQSIAFHFPELNIAWLLTGEGSMLKTSENVSQVQSGHHNTQVANNGVIIGENQDEINTLKLENARLKGIIDSQKELIMLLTKNNH